MRLDRAFQCGVLLSALALVGWKSVAPMLEEGRYLHTATVLPGGEVLVVGGFTAYTSDLLSFQGMSSNTAVRYRPLDDTWSPPGVMNASPSGRAGHTATLLPNGSVLVAGGGYMGGIHKSAALYTAAGAWVEASPMADPRAGHAAVLVQGKVLVSGGLADTKTALNATEVFDPAEGPTGKWLSKRAMSTTRVGHTLTKLQGGKVLAVGGFVAPPAPPVPLPTPLPTCEIYDPSSDAWAPGPLEIPILMSTGRFFHTATLLEDGRVLVAGGVAGLPTNTSEIFDPKASKWTSSGEMKAPRYGHAAVRLENGAVLVTGGLDQNGESLETAEIFDPSTGEWKDLTPMTSTMNEKRGGHTAVGLSNGNVLVVGGVNAGAMSVTMSAEVLDLYATGTDCSDDVECKSGYCFEAEAPQANFCCEAACDPDNECTGKETECFPFDDAGGTGTVKGQCQLTTSQPDGTPCELGICLAGDCIPDPTTSIGEEGAGLGGGLGGGGAGGSGGGAGFEVDVDVDTTPRLVGGGCLGELPEKSAHRSGAASAAAAISIALGSVFAVRRRRSSSRPTRRPPP